MNRLRSMSDIAPDTPAPASGPAAFCRHLRTNGMYLFDNAPEDDDHEASGAWCQRTMKSYGPDDDLVSRRDCRDSCRRCHEPL